MELLNQLELVDVTFEDSKAVLVFLHADRGEIREITFNKASYNEDTKKFVTDPEKAEKVETLCQEHFGLTFDNLAQAIGERKDIYAYPTFNSLNEMDIVEKFGEDSVGEIFETIVTEVEDDGKAIHIKFEFEGKKYSSKMAYSNYMESRKEWFVDPVKRDKQFAKFKEKFDIEIADKEEMVGKKIMCEVKKFGKYTFVEVKPFKKKK